MIFSADRGDFFARRRDVLMHFNEATSINFLVKAVRFLWALFASLATVILYAFPAALAVETGEWYSSLLLPRFALAGGGYTAVTALVYAADVAALSSLVYGGERGIGFCLPVATGFFNVFLCYVFFRLRSLTAAAVVAGIALACTVACAAVNIRKNAFAATVFCVKTLWNAYLFALAIAVAAAN